MKHKILMETIRDMINNLSINYIIISSQPYQHAKL